MYYEIYDRNTGRLMQTYYNGSSANNALREYRDTGHDLKHLYVELYDSKGFRINRFDPDNIVEPETMNLRKEYKATGWVLR